MKNIWKSLICAAFGVFALTSCEDVPAPYPIPNSNGGSGSSTDLITVNFVSGQGKWAIQDKANSSIWSHDSQYGMKASAFKSGNKEASESWLVSPEIDLTSATGAVMIVEEAINKIDAGDPKELMTVHASTDNGATWEPLAANARPAGTSWTMQEDKFDLSNYDGKKLKVAFKYVSTTESAGTWEIKTVKIQGVGSATIEGGSTPDTPTDITGDGSKEKPYTVTDVCTVYNSGQTPTGVWVKGYIVGYVADKSLAESATFSGTDATSNTNVLIAESADETDYTKCVPVQLPANDVRTRINLKDHADNYKAEVSLYGDIVKYFGVAGLKNTTKYIIGSETNDSGDNPDPGTTDSTFDQDFTKGIGGWAIQNVEIGSLNYVWQQTTQYGMKASAYVNKTNNAAESWLISPALAVGEKKTLTFSNCLNFLNSGTLADFVSVMVSTDYSDGLPATATWTALDFTPQPDGKSYTWVDSKADISAYANKNIRIAFKYVSTTSIAPTWEIKSVKAE